MLKGGRANAYGVCPGVCGNAANSARRIYYASKWITLHKDELLADWELAQNGETPYNIDPLK
ncbi:MAG: DUF4160 domain-containing protein [Spirochaetaceae bacterium]|nr:DUF4160 domain-containing protein [Spirochaetaceae bacterium]